jgi:non-ribosomal peptide synthetase-like protein
MLVCKQTDNAIRWEEGERLDHLFEARCDEFEKASGGSPPAVITDEKTYTFRDLDNRANQAAHHLIAQGVKCGDKVGLLFDKGVDAYVALLAVLKVNAAYVPFDGGFPNERIAFIMEDAGVTVMLSQELFREKVAEFDMPVIFLDSAADKLDKLDASRLTEKEKGKPKDEVAYLIYTSGTTGRPKGVVIEHASICNFVRVAAEIYGYGPEDRVYQGMTIAFDFSVEELWVPLLAGSALVPSKPGANLVGNELADYLRENKVTGWACVPTLLATIEKDLPDLRLLLVSGEACPPNLVTRWARDGRRILNAYGPTEATVTCTLTELVPGKPVTIGKPLPTYTIVILDPDKPQELPDGTMGEICVAGIGLAQGYLNRPELTAEKFIPDFIGIPNNPSKRIYRSGDLGCINTDGEIEFYGRIDTQVKVRGYRIELTEIESVLMEFPQIAQAVVDTWEPEPGAVELVAYYALNEGEQELDLAAVSLALRSRLPRYMVPAYIERLPIIPMTPSNKADRKNLPAPKGPRFVARDTDFVAPKTETEKNLTNTLADTLKVDRISVTDHFFQDLGAHSLLMAQFCTKLREQSPQVDVSMRDIYLHPTIGGLADFLETKPEVKQTRTVPENYRIPTNLEYYGCGALQFLAYSTYLLFGFWVLFQGIIWIFAGTTWLDLYGRILGFSVLVLAFWLTLPIAMKWLVIGKWKAEKIPIWSLRYFRFWVIKWLVTNNPMVAFKGLPLFNVYLRLLGAKIGKNVVFDAKHIPVCTDLLSVGDNTLIRKDTFILGYKARSGYIYTGPISIGKNAYVGEAGVLDIHTVMEDNTQLGHVSSLQENQIIPAGKHYHGSPAEETSSNYNTVEPRKCTTLRRTVYTVLPLFGLFTSGPALAALLLYWLRYWVTSGTGESFFSILRNFILTFNLFELAIISLVLFFSSIVLALLAISVVPRVLNLFLKEDRVYVLFGVHYWIFKSIRVLSTSKFLNLLFGDSSAVVYYLKLIGYDLSDRIVQSGSNFGVEQSHDNPHLCSFGTGTMVADGLSMSNMQMSSTSFKVNRTTIGAENYVGNDIHYPPDGKSGKNCLLGTKVMIPIDGKVREDVGLLGSPCFEIPRIVDRDKDLSGLSDESVRRQHLRKKNVHNLMTALSFLFWYWLFSVIIVAMLYAAVSLYGSLGLFSFVATIILMIFVYIGYFIALERATMALARLKPQITSIYDRAFWRVERYWKHSEDSLKSLFVGTPFKNIITRLSGAKLGKKVFDDGLALSEKPMVEIGDYCTFNADCGLQSHSLEEGVFKCDHIKMGTGATVGVNVLVHYGTTIGDNAVIEQDSFFMKGETAKPNTTWRGNPAREV